MFTSPGEIAFSIKDSGQGIAPEDIDKLFGSYAQVDTKKNHYKEGTGLGLAISKQFVEMMGGHIGVKSKYGDGYMGTSSGPFADKRPVYNGIPTIIRADGSITELPDIHATGFLEVTADYFYYYKF